MRIEFIPGSKDAELLFQAPKSAKAYIPNWYKNTPVKSEKNMDFDEIGIPQLNIKHCMPFIDALTTGYTLETPYDVMIYEEEGILKYTTASVVDSPNMNIIGHRSHANVTDFDGFYETEMIWKTHWRAKTPKGYSVLITHPLSRIDLPFFTLSGVIDSDHFYHTPIGSIPFYIKAGFKGLIPAGTPMYQIIPFKREDWDSSLVPYSEDVKRQRNYQIRKYLWGGYKTLFRQKKTYR
jgi:hypothetical protein